MDSRAHQVHDRIQSLLATHPLLRVHNTAGGTTGTAYPPAPAVSACSRSVTLAFSFHLLTYGVRVELVILAAGHGRRFGGLKQLAPVGPNGESIIDYTALDAMSSGFTRIILVIRQEIEDEMRDHVTNHWPAELPWEAVCQEGHAGTAQAVYSAAPHVSGPFGIANADDFYGLEALELLASQLKASDKAASEAATQAAAPAPHLLIGYRLSNTVFTDATVTRGICRQSDDADLVEIVEQKVTACEGGFLGVPVSSPGSEPAKLSGDELVSMNLWGMQPVMLDRLKRALDEFDPPPPPPDAEKPPELLLPEVVGRLVRSGEEQVKVHETSASCIGITHPDDLEFVRKSLAGRRPGDVVPGPA